MIEFARTHIISRSAGHSAIAAAAYRSGTDMYDDRTGSTHRYSVRADEVAYSEILMPEGSPDYLSDREEFWAAAELAEDSSTRRSTAQLAKDHIIALPREMSLKDQIEMAREFAQTELVAHGVAVDLNVHLHSKDNPHAHLMTTTRTLDEYGFGKKARHLNGGFYGGKKVPAEEQMRHQWAAFQNRWCRTVTNNDGQWRAQRHVGRNIKYTEHKQPELVDENKHLTLERQREIIENPLKLVERLTRHQAVFTRKDLQVELFRHITDQDTYQEGMESLEKVLADGRGLVEIGRVEGHMRYTSSDNLNNEIALSDISQSMMKVKEQFACKDKDRQEILVKDFAFFSDEQKEAVRHISQGNRISVVVGLAGAGKSTMLKAANQLWKKQGLNVQGIALAGIAARGLQEGADIESRTLASWHYGLKSGKVKLNNKSVVVMDEAGMVDTKLMLETAKRIEDAGAKLVMVGDPEQLQAINAGGPLRSVMQRAGYCEIAIVRRQTEEWQRKATKNLAQGKTGDAFAAYAEHNRVHWDTSTKNAIQRLADDTVQDLLLSKSMAVLAHTNAHVDHLNSIIRQQLIDKKYLTVADSSFISSRGKINLTTGDRVLFRKNDRGIGVQNGSVGTVVKFLGGDLSVKLDTGKLVKFNGSEYDSISHGYAMTIHKSQGVTVDHTRVLVGSTYDKHLSYVALSRHRKSTDVYVASEGFSKGEGSIQENFQRTMSRENIEESAIDFANRHGLELSGVEFKQNLSMISQADQDKYKLHKKTAEKYRIMIQPILDREKRLVNIVEDITDQVFLAKRPNTTPGDETGNSLEIKLDSAKAALRKYREYRNREGGVNHETWLRASSETKKENPALVATVKALESKTKTKNMTMSTGRTRC